MLENISVLWSISKQSQSSKTIHYTGIFKRTGGSKSAASPSTHKTHKNTGSQLRVSSQERYFQICSLLLPKAGRPEIVFVLKIHAMSPFLLGFSQSPFPTLPNKVLLSPIQNLLWY